MTDTDSPGSDPLGHFIRTFYDVRRTASRSGDLDLLRPFIAPEVRWCEPDVGAHIGVIEGRDVVPDMIRRALKTTGGSFDLRVTSTVETASHVAASVAWFAAKGRRHIDGQELAVFEVRDDQIVAAWFHPGDIADDEAFWGALLARLHPHALRHWWNFAFSREMDNKPEKGRLSPQRQEKIRAHAMGWQEGSGSARRYNRRFTVRETRQASLNLAETANKLRQSRPLRTDG